MTTKITKIQIQNMKIGEKIFGEGLEVRKSVDGISFYANKQCNGSRLRNFIGTEKDGMNLSKARKELVLISASVPQKIKSGRSNPNITFIEAADHYIQESKESLGKNIKQKEQQLRDHLKPFFGNTKIKDITTLDVEKFQKERIDKKAAISTVNRECATLRHMLRSISDWGIIEAKHIKVKNLKGEKQNCKTFSNDQINKMLTAAKQDRDGYTFFFVAIGFLTSMRHSEILKIKFEHFDSRNKTLYIPEAKAGSRMAPVSDQLLAIIADEQSRRGVLTGYLFDEPNSKTGHRSYMKKQFQRCLKAAGLDQFGFTPHTMRHTAISALMASGTSIKAVQAFSGHASTQMLMRYTHVVDSSVREAVNGWASNESAFGAI